MAALPTLLRLRSLPVWRGVCTRPGPPEAEPFELGWDPAGFARQTTDATVIARIVADYASDDYVHMTSPPGSSQWATRLGEARLDFVRRVLAPAAGRTFLEIGGGTLHVAERLVRDLGAARCTVIDPALRIDGPIPEGIVARREYFTPTVATEFSVDVVLGFHVFEHTSDPLAFLGAARRAIRSRDGCVVLSIPNCERDFRNATLAPFVHEHIGYFTDATVRALFSRAGFEVVGSETGHGVLSYVLAPADEFGKVAMFPSPPVLMASLGERVESFLTKTKREFDAAFATGATVAIHGATAGVNSLFHLLGAPYRDRALVFDGDASKTGRYLPSLTQAIRHASDPSYRDVDRVFIAVPGYWEEIEQFLMRSHGFERRALSILGDPAA